MISRKWGISIFLTVFVLAFLQGCTRYEDGPLISLRSVDSRLVGAWKVKTFNGTAVAPGIIYDFHEDGTFLTTGNPHPASSSGAEKGTWEWDANDKKAIILRLDGRLTGTHNIRQLKKKEMKIEVSFEFSTPYFEEIEFEKEQNL